VRIESNAKFLIHARGTNAVNDSDNDSGEIQQATELITAGQHPHIHESAIESRNASSHVSYTRFNGIKTKSTEVIRSGMNPYNNTRNNQNKRRKQPSKPHFGREYLIDCCHRHRHRRCPLPLIAHHNSHRQDIVAHPKNQTSIISQPADHEDEKERCRWRVA